jgi:hypothetical protein
MTVAVGERVAVAPTALTCLRVQLFEADCPFLERRKRAGMDYVLGSLERGFLGCALCGGAVLLNHDQVTFHQICTRSCYGRATSQWKSTSVGFLQVTTKDTQEFQLRPKIRFLSIMSKLSTLSEDLCY